LAKTQVQQYGARFWRRELSPVEVVDAFIAREVDPLR
jgi:hypothetical protein